MNQTVINIIEDIKTNYNPEMVILFGSYALNRQTEESDIDLLVIKETDKRPLWRRVDALLAVKSKIPVVILVYTPKEFETFIKDKKSFLYNIYSSGKIVFNKKDVKTIEN